MDQLLNSRMMCFLIVIAMLLAFNLPASLILYNKFMLFTENQGHAWLLLAATAYLFSTHKSVFTPQSSISKKSLFGLLVASLLNIISYTFNILLFEQYAMILFAMSGYHLFFKFKDSLQACRLFLLLLFVTTTFDHLVPVLVTISSLVVDVMVRSVGLVAFIDGPMIELPYGRLLIADSCSGVRYLIVGLAIACLLGVMDNLTVKENIKLAIYAVIISLVVNWVRIFLLVVIGDWTQMQSSLMHDHELFGFVLFFVFYAPLFFIRFGSRNNGNNLSIDTRQEALDHNSVDIYRVHYSLFFGIVIVVAAINYLLINTGFI